MARIKKRKLENGVSELMEVDGADPNVSGPSNAGNVPAAVEASESEDECDHISDDEEGGFRLGDIYIPPAPKPALTFDPTGPRLVISHIVNVNFKSYAGTQSLGPFHKSFTAIIGPNGSGKSNVIDAMLFVFGYRATKIRSKKISVLIHSSSKYPKCMSATVSVHFCQIIDGPDESFTIVPNSEVVVSRTAFKDNTSNYMLNGRRVVFKEVAVVLRGLGIDLDHNRFLILQGEVEQIAMMKPKAATVHEFGMLEYLEDIVGTSRYKVPIEKLTMKVEELSEKRKEKLNRVRLVEQEKAVLEEPMRTAVELMNLCNEKTVYQNMLLQKYINEVKNMSREKEELKARTEINLQELSERQNVINLEIREKNVLIQECDRQMMILKKKMEDIKARLSDNRNETALVESDISVTSQMKKKIRKLIGQEQSKITKNQLIPEKNQKEIEECTRRQTQLIESKREVEEELQTLQAEVSEQLQGLAEIRVRLLEKRSGLATISDAASAAHYDAVIKLEQYRNSAPTYVEQLRNAKDEYIKTKTLLEEKKQMKQQLAPTLLEQERRLNELLSNLENCKAQEVPIANENRILRYEVNAAKEAMQINRSRSRTLEALMMQKRNGTLPGIFGRLGDLGGINEKYDVAISSGCGGLNSIVVDCVETAYACVKFLKANDIGRARFIALDKQQYLKKIYQTRQKFPEGVPRMFDLITVTDQRVLPAFYFVLRDTLVATDLDQASRIAYGAQRHRVVTLRGDVIEISGTMTGGGKTVIRGRMGTSVQEHTCGYDPAVLQAKERRLEQITQSLNENHTQQRAIENEIQALQATVENGKKNLEIINQDLLKFTNQIPTLEETVEDKERAVEANPIDEAHEAQLEADVLAAKERFDKVKFDIEQVDKEISELDAEQDALEGDRANQLQKKFDDLENEIKDVFKDITKLTNEIASSKRLVDESSNAIAQMEANFAETVRKLEIYDAQIRQITMDNTQLQKEYEEIEQKIAECPSQFSSAKEEKAKLVEKLDRVDKQKIDLASDLKAIQKSILEYANKTPIWERELRSLKLVTIRPDESGITIPGLEAVDPLIEHTEEALEAVNVDELRARVNTLEQRLGSSFPNVNAVEEYRAKEALYLQRAAELEAITLKRNEARDVFDGLKKRRQTEFLAGFNTITGKLKEMYQMITLGGDAELELVDSLDPFTEGIIFSVRPPNKSWKNISNLSGGEKTLSSLALVFALHYYKPTPLYVMDEIDAALDFKNVSIVANYIKDRTKNAQFIIISLRYMMFEACNRLIGIYKTADCTRCICITNKEQKPEEESTLDVI